MKLQEFSDTFDALLNSYNTKAQFGDQASRSTIVLDEYEKSVILTQAQDIIVKTYFDSKLNSQAQGFDDSERRQVDFSSLIKSSVLTKASNQDSIFDKRGIIYKFPTKASDSTTSDVLFVLNEKITIGSKDYVVIPISYKEYDREMSKAYAQPLKKQIWRLFQNNQSGFDIYSEIIPNVNLSGSTMVYKVRYVRRPNPIVLTNLPNDLSIDGVTVATECELHPILHMDILNKALEIAVATRGGGSQGQIAQALNSSSPQ